MSCFRVPLLAAVLALTVTHACAASADRLAALGTLRTGDVVRVSFATGIVVEGSWRGVLEDSLRLGAERPLPIDGMVRLDVRRPSWPRYAIAGGVIGFIMLGIRQYPSTDSGQKYFDAGDAIGGAVACGGIAAIAASRFTHWSPVYPPPHPFAYGLQQPGR